MSSQRRAGEKSFVTNFRSEDINKETLMIVARNQGIDAKIGEPIGNFSPALGLYVHWRTINLTEFWESYYEISRVR